MRSLKRVIISLALAIPVAPAFGANCQWITTPSTVALGNYSVFATTATATTTQFDFRCTPNQYARLLLSTGGAGVFVPSRLMKNGSNTAQYNIYLDAGGTQIWGDRTGGSVTYDVYNSTPSNKDFIDNMYGIAPAGQDLATGNYADTVFATLQYSNNATGPWNSLPAVTINVTMTVINECRVDSFNLNFGTYLPLSTTPLTQSTLLKVYCTKGGAPLSVVFNNGSYALGTQPRMLGSTGDFLSYNPALGSTAGTSTSSLVPINGGFTLSGSIPARQNVSVGSYTDTLVASVNY